MKNLYEVTIVNLLKQRIGHLHPDSAKQWGNMNVAQMLAHSAAWLEMAAGENNPPRMFIGFLLGRWVKSSITNDAPMPQNVPTEKSLIRKQEYDFLREKTHLIDLLNRFEAAGPEGCTKHPHCFFGPLAPEQWAVLGFKHLDHHLRQFGV